MVSTISFQKSIKICSFAYLDVVYFHVRLFDSFHSRSFCYFKYNRDLFNKYFKKFGIGLIILDEQDKEKIFQ